MTTSSVPAEPAVVRAVRVSTYVLLTLAALPVLFLLPFMFDDPKMGHPIPALLLFAAVLSPVGAIAFTRGAYRRAVASEQWGRCLGWTLLPLVIPLPLFMSIRKQRCSSDGAQKKQGEPSPCFLAFVSLFAFVLIQSQVV